MGMVKDWNFVDMMASTMDPRMVKRSDEKMALMLDWLAEMLLESMRVYWKVHRMVVVGVDVGGGVGS